MVIGKIPIFFLQFPLDDLDYMRVEMSVLTEIKQQICLNKECNEFIPRSGRGGKTRLRADLYGSAVRDQAPNFFNFNIIHGDTTFGPVEIAVVVSNFIVVVFQAVQHDAAAG